MPDYAIFTSISMTRRVNILIPAPVFMLDMFYPFNPLDVHPTRSVVVDIVKNGVKMAPFVHECLPAHITPREPYASQTITPPYVKELRDLKGCDLSEREAGMNPFLDQSTAERVQTVQEADMQQMDANIDRREEWMACRQLTHDAIPVRGEGMNADLSIGLQSTHKINATTAWSTTTGDAPITDLEIAQGLIADSGFTATDAIMGRTAWQNFRKNNGVKELLDLRNVNGNALQMALITTGAVFRGEFNGLRIWTYWANYIDDQNANTVTPLIPHDQVLIGSQGGDGRRHYALVQDLDAPGGAAAVRRFAKSWREPNPSVQYTLVQSAPLPVMHTPDAWVRLDTLP